MVSPIPPVYSRLIAALVITSVVLWSTSAWAQTPLADGLTVQWLAPSECPDAASVHASIGALLRESWFKNGNGPLSFRGTVSLRDGRYRLEVEAHSPTGKEANPSMARRAGS